MAKSNWMKDENQKGNFSNNQEDTFDPGKNYVGIRLQQGVPLLDRDWNELEDIRRYAGVMLRKYFIGNGVPDENSFKITAADPPVNDFKIAAGRCLVEGFEAINDPVDPEGNKLGFILYSQQEGILPLNVPDADRTDTVYLDVWIEEVSGANEPTLKNPQDVDMETCIRHKLEWRVRVNEGSQGYQKEPYHYYYDIARIHRKAKKEKIDDTDSSAKIEDLRVIGLVLHRLTDRSNADDKHKHSRLAAPDGSPDPALVVDNNANVGIGTPSPDRKLHVNGTMKISRPGNEDRWTTDNHSKGIELENGNSIQFLKGGVGGSRGISGNLGILYFMRSSADDNSAAATYDMVIDADGNVGIGTTSPSSKLHINNDSHTTSLTLTGAGMGHTNAEIVLEATNSNNYRGLGIFMHDAGGDTEWYAGTPYAYADQYQIGRASGVTSHSGATAQVSNAFVTIKNNGNVGIGTPSPGTTLEVNNGTLRVSGGASLGQDSARLVIDPGPSSGHSFFECRNERGIMFKIYGNGNTSSRALSSVSSDYAEYFESKDGKEIMPGISVLLDNGKIRPAKENEIPIGVMSASPGIVGGVHLEWPKKYLRDEFGNQIMEDYKEEIVVPKKMKVKKERQKVDKKKVKEKVKRTEVVKKKGKHCRVEVEETEEREIEEPLFKEVDLYDAAGKKKIGKHQIPVMETYEEEIDVLDDNGQPVMVGSGKFATKTRPKINPEYDETKEYIPREKRPEWNCVGLLGQLPLRKGQPTVPTWIKIKDISKDVELWLVK